MKLPRVAFFLYVPVAAIILLCGMWYIAIPDSVISDLIENSLKDGNMSIQVTHLKKGLFFNLSLERIELKKSGNALLSIENATGRINPLSLLMMRLTLYFSGNIGGGTINGRMDLIKGKNHVGLDIRNAHLEEMPFFVLIGLDGKGVLSGGLSLDNGEGNTRLDIREMALKSGVFGGASVPLELFDSARGAFSISSGVLKVVSFTFEGRGIYARIKGLITSGATNLTMELMPDRTFTASNPLFYLLENYKVSPGFYSIPINSNLPF
ncbi:MAG: type II secretion system protein GspN [Nitrospirae bacterium]|nr:type II secretion system protein GspN [Nitrospirota bacterium]